MWFWNPAGGRRQASPLRRPDRLTMRIFHATQTTPNPWYLPQSRLWHVNLYLPLLDLGHELVTFQGDYGEFYDYLDPRTDQQRDYVRRNRPRLSEDLLRQVKAAHRQKPIDLLFGYFYSAQVEPEAIREIGRMGITTVNWYCNGSFQFHLVEEIAPAFDYCLVPEKFRLRRLPPGRREPHLLPGGRQPERLQAARCAGRVRRHLRRPALRQPPGPHQAADRGRRGRPRLGPALGRAAGEPVSAGRNRLRRGPSNCRSWTRRCSPVPGPALPDDELVKMYSRSRISLGFSAVAQRPRPGEPPIKQVRLRDFEAPMSGGVLPGRAVRRAGGVLRAGQGDCLLRGCRRSGGEGEVLPEP